MLYKPVTIHSIHEEIKGFKTFVFEEGHNISYHPGQYLTFVHRTPLEEIRRSYSITSTPFLHEPLSIGIKRIRNGAFSRQLVDHARPGDELITTGVGGFFTLPKDMNTIRQLFFLAAGSGITPVYSLLKTVLHLYPHVKVVLIYSNASAQKTIFHTQLHELHVLFADRFHVQFLFSDSFRLDRARLNRELLLHFLMQYGIDETWFYICGPEAYMRMCTYTLQEEQVPHDRIRRENFIMEKMRPAKVAPPDKNTYQVQIKYGETAYSFPVHYPDSILQAAKKQGISLPYSCETGKCGNCAAKCLSGNVWLSYNEVLTEKEIKEGITLTCVGHPVGGDVTLRI